LRRLLLLLAFFSITSTTALSQALPVATRAGDLQVGGGFTYGTSDYATDHVRGITFYSSFDFRKHFGAEVDFHQLKDPNSTTLYERSYEIGGRYIRRYDVFTPYAKLLYGRGVYNFPPNPPPAPQSVPAGNLAYNMFAGAAGVDIAVRPRINVRAELEYQRWLGGLGLPNGLTPLLFTFGAAYHFSPGTPTRLSTH
jgi:hypothetical protein